jgi:DNA polymerase III subunit gamma/tau
VLAELATALSEADVQLYYQTALIGRRDLHLAPDPRGGAEMTLLRMLAFRPAAASGSAPAPAASAPKRNPEPVPEQSATNVAAAPEATPSTAEGEAWQDPDWIALAATLPLKGAARMLAINCAYLRRTGNTLYFSADRKAESVLTRERQQALGKALSAHFGETLSVDIALDDGAPAAGQLTPVQKESRDSDQRYAAARAALEADPNIKALKSMFGAELKSETIEPLTPRRPD